MMSSGPNYTKLKTNLRLAVTRLKLLEKKKTELTQKARKEIADYITAGKVERAKIRVEHIIREDYLVESMEVVEMFCDLLLARYGLIQQMRVIDDGLAEAISSIIWATPRLQTDIPELKLISDQLGYKYGKQYIQACRDNGISTVSEKLIHKLGVQAPPKLLVEKYLITIAKTYNIEYEPDPQVMRSETIGVDALLVDLGDGPNDFNSGGAGGGQPQPAGFLGYPACPLPAQAQPNAATGAYKPFNYPGLPGSQSADSYPTKPAGENGNGQPPLPAMGPTAPFNSIPATVNPNNFNIPPANENVVPFDSPPDPKSVSCNSYLDQAYGGGVRYGKDASPPPPYSSFPPDFNPPAPPVEKNNEQSPTQANSKANEVPKPAPRGKIGNGITEDDLDLLNLPSVPNNLPSPAHSASPQPPPPDEDEIDFDDLSRRFDALKKKK